MTIEVLKTQTGISDVQLDMEIVEGDLDDLAGCCGNYKNYLYKLGLTRAQCADLSSIEYRLGHELAMREALVLWRRRNQSVAKFRTLIDFALILGKHQDAIAVSKYVIKNK